ncbi:MAG: flavodoxin family protein [Desulfobacterales bacterium]
MKKVLGIIGSPRRLGNSEIMVKEISRRIDEEHRLRLLRLADFNIRPCRGCYRCLFGSERCVQKDDFQTVLEAVVEADALVLAAPTYFLGANAVLKGFLDRGLAFYAHIERLWGKPSVGVCIAGIPGKEGHGMLGVENFLRMLLSCNKASRVVYGALPGEVFLGEANRKAAAELARALFATAGEKRSPSCPRCGGDTFRFLSAKRVRCMLCSNEGTVAFGPDGPVFSIGKSEHDMFLSKEAAVAHRDWLRGMKDRFVAQKTALKEVTVGYRKEGEWITPKRETDENEA